MADGVGVQETLDVVNAIDDLGVFLVKRLKDGAGWDDAMALMNELSSDTEFRAAMLKAAVGIQNVPAEIKDLDFSEIGQIATAGVTNALKIVEAFKE